MKMTLKVLKNEAAGTLLVTLVTMTLLAVSIAGYLYYVQQQSVLGARSQHWNVAMTIAEAGVEEGMEALNNDVAPMSHANGDGWSASGNIYTLSRTLPQG